MRAGRLRHRVIIQTATRATDGGGGASVTWANDATMWSEIEPLEGSERYEAQKMNPKLSHKVTLRYWSGCAPKKRILYGTRIFNIESVKNTKERNVEMVLMCEEIVA